MTRSIGIRSRLVTGYLASEYNEIGGYYIVRQSHAHAWCEIDCGTSDWKEFDPTPPVAAPGSRRLAAAWPPCTNSTITLSSRG